jgi:osmoprotectant transport system substrate-binding protein
VNDALRRGEIDVGVMLAADPSAVESDAVRLTPSPMSAMGGSFAPAVAHTLNSEELRAVLDGVSAVVSTDVLSAALRAVNEDDEAPDVVAARLLHDAGFGDGSSAGPTPVVGVDIVRAAPSPSTASAASGPLVVGSSPTVAGQILAHLYGQLLTSTGVDVQYAEAGIDPRHVPEALSRGDVDLLPTLLGNDADWLNADVNGPLSLPISSPDPANTRTMANTLAAERGYRFLAPAPAQQSSVFAVTSEFARRTGVRSLSALAAYSRNHAVRLATPPDCTEQFFCLPLLKAYGLRAVGVETTDWGGPLTRKAIVDGYVQAGWLTNTDPGLVTYDLVALADDRGLQPAWNVTPALSLRRSSPQVAEALDALSRGLTTADVTSMLTAVDVGRQSIDSVVSAYLRERGLVG